MRTMKLIGEFFSFEFDIMMNVACEQKSLTMSGFLGSLESSGWLKHIRAILDTSQ